MFEFVLYVHPYNITHPFKNIHIFIVLTYFSQSDRAPS